MEETVSRPWGRYTVLDSGQNYKIKRVEVLPGHRLSLQKHLHRAEHWVVVSGAARITRGEEEFVLNINESTYIPKDSLHRLENRGKIPLILIEIQSGEYLGEDDIERFEDDYDRGNK